MVLPVQLCKQSTILHAFGFGSATVNRGSDPALMLCKQLMGPDHVPLPAIWLNAGRSVKGGRTLTSVIWGPGPPCKQSRPHPDWARPGRPKMADIYSTSRKAWDRRRSATSASSAWRARTTHLSASALPGYLSLSLARSPHAQAVARRRHWMNKTPLSLLDLGNTADNSGYSSQVSMSSRCRSFYPHH
jgi:hypothetical protein